MSLTIRNLRFFNFRNYAALALDDIGKTTVFIGKNAVGKTNIVEGIQLLTALESFRKPTTDMLIRWGSDQGFIQADLSDGARQLEMKLVLDSNGRHYQLNGKKRARNELQGQLPAVLFCPDDLQLVKGGPDIRRAALDALGMQVSKNYQQVKSDYEKLLRQKNRLLKEDVSSGYLDSINEVLARIGSQLIVYRIKMVKGIARLLPIQHQETTGTTDLLSLEYESSVPIDLNDENTLSRDAVEESFHKKLKEREADEMTRHTSLVGPHRDKPVFLLNGYDAGDFASQGQQRSIAIAYKLAELHLLEELTQQKPILLLDDVMSELDTSRRETLTKYVHQAAQTFITTTNMTYFTPEFLQEAQVVKLPLMR